MARGYACVNDPLRAIIVFSHVLCPSLVPDDYTFSSLLNTCSKVKALEEGKQLHCFALKHGVRDNVYIIPTLINMYTACGDIDVSRRVFDKIEEPYVVAYNAIITSLARNSQLNEALALFREMQERSLKPTDVTMLVVLLSCTLHG
ncbi:unnamed protein product [Lathyrus oleraceus]